MRTFWFALAATLIAAMPGCAPGSDSAGDRVVELPVPDDPTITFKVWFQAGSSHDPAGREGLAFLTGQMIAEASTEANSFEEINEKLYPLASGYGIRVDREMTVLTGRTHRDNLSVFYELFTDAYLRPAFTAEDFERLKSDQLNYLENTLRYQADEELGKAALYGAVFEGTPYAHPPQGTVGGVKSITLEDVKAFYAAHYRHDNAVAAIGGGYEAALAEELAASLDGLAASESAPAGGPAPTPAPIEATSVLLVSNPEANASISFGFPIDVQRGEEEFYALWLANSWLGEHRNSSSHLYQVIRETRGMNYGDYSYIEAFPEGGRRSMPPTHVARSRQMFEVWIRTLPDEQAHFALRAAVRELRKLVENGMTAEDFELTREFLKKYRLHYADTTSGRLGYAVDDRFYGVPAPGHLARFDAMMDGLTLDTVNAAVKKHLRWDRLQIAIVTGDADGLSAALASDAPSPMTYGSEKPPEVLEEDKEIESFPLEIAEAAIRVVPVEQIFE